jgi:hypothetical protein
VNPRAKTSHLVACILTAFAPAALAAAGCSYPSARPDPAASEARPAPARAEPKAPAKGVAAKERLAKKAPVQIVRIPRGEGRDVNVLFVEYATDVIAYEKKYAGKYVEMSILPPVTIRKDGRGYYLPQLYLDGQVRDRTDVRLRKADAELLSAYLKAGKGVPRLLVRIAADGFGFLDGHFERPGAE